MYTAGVRPPVVLISAGHLNSYLTHLLAKIKTHTAESGGEKRKKNQGLSVSHPISLAPCINRQQEQTATGGRRSAWTVSARHEWKERNKKKEKKEEDNNNWKRRSTRWEKKGLYLYTHMHINI